MCQAPDPGKDVGHQEHLLVPGAQAEAVDQSRRQNGERDRIGKRVERGAEPRLQAELPRQGTVQQIAGNGGNATEQGDLRPTVGQCE
ncbi:hypothetical protein D3C87_1888390 [compost metagenome]